MLKTKSVHEPKEPQDGLRILATRYRGRGLPVDRYDIWMANLGPSESLLKARADLPWAEWARRYREQMLPATAEPANPGIRDAGQKFTLRLLRHLAEREDATLLCHCAAGATECHRHLLKNLIERV